MKGGWITPAGSFLKKIMHIYESSSMMLGPLLAVSSWQRGIFSFWLRVISTILPLFHSPLKPSSPLSQTAFLRASILAFSLLEKHRTFFSPPTTWPLSLEPWSASTLDHLSPLLSLPSLSPLYPSMDIFILRMLDVWATACWKWHFHCPPVVEMDFE